MLLCKECKRAVEGGVSLKWLKVVGRNIIDKRVIRRVLNAKRTLFFTLR